MYTNRPVFSIARNVVIIALFLPLVMSCSGKEQLVSGDGTVDWNRYYSTEETHQIMRAFTDMYPDLTRMFSIGKSLKNADLYVMEVSNRKIGAPEEKPALYVDGNIHSGELTGSAVTLYLMGYLLNNYGKDPAVTELLDSRTVYLRPKFNPDGADLALLKNVSLRSTTRPVDNDRDGLADEDPGDDLDGDGFITQMRIPDPEGNMKKSPDDPRLMVRRDRGETGGEYYRVIGEGIDNDGDGRLNEDGIGGLDMNRNFPRNWELQYLQSGAGAFPLSEPETYATLQFMNKATNICFIIHNHTSGGFLYRLPSTGDPSTFPPDDLELIVTLSDKYNELTGRRVSQSYTSPQSHRYGTLISWGYWDRGIIGWVPEYWGGIEKDYDGDGNTSELERLKFNDEELGGKYFSDWTSYDHPEFGSVEIGGWHRMFISQNPPDELLEQECAEQIPWIMYIAQQTPMLEMSEPSVTAVGDNRYRVEVTVTNDGFIPTNLVDRAINARLIKEVEVELEMTGAALVVGERKTRIGHLAGSRPVSDDRPGARTVSWIVQSESSNASVTVRVVSEKGGTLSSGVVSLNR
ncbi:M14 family metallopeptidase [candidate division KSB1 bacterium]